MYYDVVWYFLSLAAAVCLNCFLFPAHCLHHYTIDLLAEASCRCGSGLTSANLVWKSGLVINAGVLPYSCWIAGRCLFIRHVNTLVHWSLMGDLLIGVCNMLPLHRGHTLILIIPLCHVLSRFVKDCYCTLIQFFRFLYSFVQHFLIPYMTVCHSTCYYSLLCVAYCLKFWYSLLTCLLPC